MDAGAALYVGTVTLLFFFWVYGIASFALDVKNKLVPAARQYVRERRRQKEEAEAEVEQQDRREELY